MKISAVYIAKNEEKNIAHSLDSLKDSVDEFILVDTGSTDNTVNIFESYGGKVFFLPWDNDFSAPRNMALSKATGDWIILLDADEYFSVETVKNLRSVIEENANADGLLLNITNIERTTGKEKDSFYNLRAVRNQKGIAYRGRIHEELLLDLKPMNNLLRVAPELLNIIHTGYTAEISVEKSKRNLEILQQEIAEGYNIEDLYTYLVECYDGIGDTANMLKYAWLDVEVGRRQTTYASRSYRKLINYYTVHGSIDERVALMEKAVADFPELPEFHAELGNCYGQNGYIKKAVSELKLAVELFKSYNGIEPCLLDSGNILQISKQISDLELKIKDTISDFDNIYSVLERGDLLKADSVALMAYKNDIQRGLAAELLVSIAIEAGDCELAYQRLSLLKALSESAYRLFLQARVFFMQKDYWQALTYLENAVKNEVISSASGQVQEKIYNLLGQCYRFYGYPDRAAECYYKAFEVVDNQELKVLEYSNYLFNLHYLPISQNDYFVAHADYNNLFAGIKEYKHKRKNRAGKIRIGYISPDFRDHVVLRFSMAMLTAYDKEKFEVYCYSTGKEDKYSEFIKGKVTAWRSLRGEKSKEIAKKIYDDKIDILVELCGHCSGSNLPVLAYKPAPVQICGIGYFATTGLKTVDYFLTDDNLNAKEEYFTEKLISLPHSHFCYMPLKNVPPVQEAPCMKNDYVTFGSFNNLTKVNDDVLTVWHSIMEAVPDSHLLLKGSLFDNTEGKQLFLQRLEALNFDLSRIELRGISKDYMAEYFDMDIALDTFSYPGGGTTCDALYMGVPVITLMDGSHGGNFGGSILKNIGLESVCAENVNEYVEKAVAIAGDRELLNALHLGLRNMMLNSKIMDINGYMKEYEERLFKEYLQNVNIDGEIKESN